MDNDPRRRDDLDDEDNDGSRGIWAAYERDGGGRPLKQNDIDVASLKERLKRAARLRAGRPNDEIS